MRYFLFSIAITCVSLPALASVETCDKGVNFYNPATYASLSGDVTCRFTDGTLARKAKVEKGAVVWVQRYTQEGVLFTEDSLKNGKKHGICKRFYETNGALKEVQAYENDRAVGVGKLYQNDGKTLLSIKHEASSTSITFNAQQKPISITCGKNYARELRNYCEEPSQLYTQSGEKARMFVPAGSKFTGALSDADKDVAYKGGLRDGKAISKDSHGRITAINHYKNGELSGEQVTYFADSNQIKERYFYDAKRKQKTRIEEFFQNGKPKLVKEYTAPDTYRMTRYFDTGKPFSKVTIVEKGLCNASETHCYDKTLDGAVFYDKDGAYEVHYYDDKGNRRLIKPFTADAKPLPEEHYYPDGSIKN